MHEEIGPEPEPVDPEDQLAAWLKDSEKEEESDPAEFDKPLETGEDDEPLTWVTYKMCVQDPFIRQKVSL